MHGAPGSPLQILLDLCWSHKNVKHGTGGRATAFKSYAHGFLYGDEWTPAERPAKPGFGEDVLGGNDGSNVVTYGLNQDGAPLVSGKSTNGYGGGGANGNGEEGGEGGGGENGTGEGALTAKEQAEVNVGMFYKQLLAARTKQRQHGETLKGLRDALMQEGGGVDNVELDNVEARFQCAHSYDLKKNGGGTIFPSESTKILEVRSVDPKHPTPWIPCSRWYGRDNLVNPGCVIEVQSHKKSSGATSSTKAKDDGSGKEKAGEDKSTSKDAGTYRDGDITVDSKIRITLENFKKVHNIPLVLDSCPEPADANFFFNTCAPPDLRMACNCNKYGHEQVWARCGNKTRWTRCAKGSVNRMELADEKDESAKKNPNEEMEIESPGSVTCQVFGRVLTRPYGALAPDSKLGPFWDFCKNKCGPIGGERSTMGLYRSRHSSLVTNDNPAAVKKKAGGRGAAAGGESAAKKDQQTSSKIKLLDADAKKALAREEEAAAEALRWPVRKELASCPGKKLSLKCTCTDTIATRSPRPPDPENGSGMILGQEFSEEGRNYLAACGDAEGVSLPCEDHRVQKVNGLHSCRVFVSLADFPGGQNNQRTYRTVIVPPSRVDTADCDQSCPLISKRRLAAAGGKSKFRIAQDPDTGATVDAERAEKRAEKSAKLDAKIEQAEAEDGRKEMDAMVQAARAGMQDEKPPPDDEDTSVRELD